jgi:hypothetical protein
VIFRQNRNTAGRVIEDRAFIITPNDNKLHTLNGSATEIWRLAATGCTVQDAAERLCQRYQVDPPRAAADAEACCRELVARGILVAADAPAP